MAERVADLTERERQTLRLLLAGHDAKSAARALDLSVHTINDYLRSSRRKLGVSSSREAARLLGEAERGTRELSAPEQIGIAPAAAAPHPADHDRGTGRLLPWLAGGIVMMTVLAAIAVFASGAGERLGLVQGEGQDMQVSAEAADAVSLPAAQQWLALVDAEQWEASWQVSGALLRSQITAESWAAIGEAARGPLGAVRSRTFRGVARTDTLPGLPTGQYEVIEFTTDFAERNAAVERVTLTRAGDAWKVDGYYIL